MSLKKFFPAFFWKIFSLRTIDMSNQDRVTLSPLEKWKKYHRFPFKLLFQCVLVVLVVLQVYVVVSQYTYYYRANSLTITEFFLPTDYRDGIFTIKDCTLMVSRTVQTYYSMNSSATQKYTPVTENGIPLPVYMTVTRYKSLNKTRDNFATTTGYYNLTGEDPLGPLFNLSEIQLHDLFFSLTTMTQSFKFETISVGQFGLIPFIWNVTLVYTNRGGLVDLTLNIQKELEVNGVLDRQLTQGGWLNIFIIVFAILSLTLSVKAIYSSLKVYQDTRAQYSMIPPDRLLKHYRDMGLEPLTSWQEIPFSVKLEFFSSWYIFSLVGDVIILAAACLSLVEDFGLGTSYSDTSRILLGLGCFAACANMTKYLEYYRKFYTLILTLRFSFMKNVRFLISVIPIFTGYCLCGIVVFGPYCDRFLDLDSTAVTLFALLNGDDIHATFEELSPFPYQAFARIYLYTFLVLFITAILNIFIFIIEDAYHAAKIAVLRSTHPELANQLMNEGEESLFFIENKGLDIYKLFDLLERESSTRSAIATNKDHPKSVNLDIFGLGLQGLQGHISDEVLQIILNNQQEFFDEFDKKMNELRKKYLKKLKKQLEELGQ